MIRRPHYRAITESKLAKKRAMPGALSLHSMHIIPQPGLSDLQSPR